MRRKWQWVLTAWVLALVLAVTPGQITKPSSGGGHVIQDESVDRPAEPKLNFLGGGVSCVDNAGVSTDCTITGAAATAYDRVQEEAVNLNQRPTINFIGGAVTCADNAGSNRTDCTVTLVGGVGFVMDGSGAVITTGGVSCKRLPYDATITGYRIYEDTIPAVSGSISIDLWVDAAYQPTDVDSITAAVPAALVAATSSCGNVGGGGGCSDITTWTRTLTAGQYMCAYVDSVTDVKHITLDVEITR